MEEKEILKEELNRTLEIMGLNVITEQKEEGLVDDEVNPIELEVVEDSTEEGEEETTEPADGGEIEVEYVYDETGQAPKGIQKISEQVVSEQVQAVVTKRKQLYIPAGKQKDGYSYVLEPYLQYKFDKSTQEVVEGSAEIFMAGRENNYTAKWMQMPVSKWAWNDKTYQLRSAMYSKSKTGRDKMPTSLTEKMISQLNQTVKDTGVSLNEDIKSSFANFYKNDQTIWVRDGVRSLARTSQSGERQNYTTTTYGYKGRDNESKEMIDSYQVRFTNSDGKTATVKGYYVNDGQAKASVQFNERGKLYNVKGFHDAWYLMVASTSRADEWYEFCNSLPKGLTSGSEWKKKYW